MRSIAIAILLLVLATSVVVAQDTYSYSFTYKAGFGYKAGLASFPDSSQGADSRDLCFVPIHYPFGPSDYGLTIYKENGKYGWDTDSGFYVLDARSPLVAGQTVVFEDIYLWAGTAVSLPSLQMELSSLSMSPGLAYSLDLVRVPTGVTYSGTTHWGANDRMITLPFVTTNDPTQGYRFRATITAVTEPSALIALGGGLVAVGLPWLRRRRH